MFSKLLAFGLYAVTLAAAPSQMVVVSASLATRFGHNASIKPGVYCIYYTGSPAAPKTRYVAFSDPRAFSEDPVPADALLVLTADDGLRRSYGYAIEAAGKDTLVVEMSPLVGAERSTPPI
ncbi:hypothetical protein FB451DRAFT_1187496 [Mycena latifolia]|nr:hypothetical protein FB451DRAFT_1187496 [Mycena latifolia]